MAKDTPPPQQTPDFAQLKRQIDQFWNQTYAAYSPAERIDYWVAQLRPGLDWARSQGIDPYHIFSPEAYAVWCEQEPAFASWLPQLAQRLGLELGAIEQQITAPPNQE